MTDERWKSPVIPWEACSQARRQKLAALWKRGELSYKLNPDQKQVYAAYRRWEKSGKGKTFVFDISRRYGKSFVMLLIAIEDAIRSSNYVIPYISKSKHMVREIIEPLVAQILQDCPPELRPQNERQRMRYKFLSGSVLNLVGVDQNYDTIRGRHLDKGFVDEAAFIDKLMHVLTSILRPQMHGRPHARILLGSTPPESPAEDWSTIIVPEAKGRRAYVHRTIRDNPLLSVAEIEEEIEAMGGEEATACRRELFAEHVVEETLAVCAEFDPNVHVEAVEPPRWRDCYTVLDPGFQDHAALTFCYWDFERQRMVIEGEWAEPRQNTDEIATQIKIGEANLWKGVSRWDKSRQQEVPQPYMRYADTERRLIEDLRATHDLRFHPVQKDRLMAMVASLKVAFSRNEIVVHPRCVKTIAHLQFATWRNINAKHPILSRTTEFGHYDLLMTVCYAWLAINRRRNPFPPHAYSKLLEGKTSENTYFRPESRAGAERFFPAVQQSDVHKRQEVARERGHARREANRGKVRLSSRSVRNRRGSRW